MDCPWAIARIGFFGTGITWRVAEQIVNLIECFSESWANHSDLSQGHPKWWFSKGIQEFLSK